MIRCKVSLLTTLACTLIIIGCKNDNIEKLKTISVNDRIEKVYKTLGKPINSDVETSPVNRCDGETLILKYEPPWGYSDVIRVYISMPDSAVCFISDGAD